MIAGLMQCWCMQLVNLVIFLTMNAIQFSRYCHTFTNLIGWMNLVMWTMWNTVFAINVMQIRLINVWQRACESPVSELCCAVLRCIGRWHVHATNQPDWLDEPGHVDDLKHRVCHQCHADLPDQRLAARM